MEHIKRFGPAILFATEAFESFNVIIHAKSVHSNRHAPSQDIAQAFAQGNHVRHLLSGGCFLLKSKATVAPHSMPNLDALAWLSAGPGPLSLVAKPSTVTQYLGLNHESLVKHGMLWHKYYTSNIVIFIPLVGVCVWDKKPPHHYRNTLVGHMLPDGISHLEHSLFKTNETLTLLNGDACPIGSFVIA